MDQKVIKQPNAPLPNSHQTSPPLTRFALSGVAKTLGLVPARGAMLRKPGWDQISHPAVSQIRWLPHHPKLIFAHKGSSHSCKVVASIARYVFF